MEKIEGPKQPYFEVTFGDARQELAPSDYQVGGDHYQTMPIQVSEFVHKNELNWCEGNAIKYICRHHLKGGKQDLEKAIHYIQLLIEWEYASSAEKKK